MIEAVDTIPGPFSIPLLGTTWKLKWRIEELVVQPRGWAIYYTDRGYGLISIWLGTRPLVIAVRPEYAKEILESNTLISKGPEYGILAPWLGTGLLTSTHEKWRRRRKMITPAFHFNVLKQFLPVFKGDHNHQSSEITNNWILQRLMGILGEQELEKDLDSPSPIVFLHQRMPWMWIDLIWKITGYDREYKENLKILHHFTLNVIRKRRSEYRENSEELTKREKKAFLDLLLEMEKDEHFTDEDIREEVDTFMFEGHDTTAASLGNGKKRDVAGDDLVQLRYLEKVVKESLRIYPSVPNLTRYVEEDTMLKDTKIPAGVTLLISPFIIHRNPEFYPDPETFNPDNFNEESISSRPSYTFIPFSAGPRNCIGERVP